MPGFTPKIPNGLEELMRGLAKSCIKQNPENLYEFAAEYFENLLRERDGTLDQNYKKFATYKVYRKSKKLKKVGSGNKESFESGNSQVAAVVTSTSVNELSREKSIEEIVLTEEVKSVDSHYREKRSLSISSESEINACIKREASFDTEAVPTKKQPSHDNVETVEDLEQIDETSDNVVEHVEEPLEVELNTDTRQNSLTVEDHAATDMVAVEHEDVVSEIEKVSENNEGEITKDSAENEVDSGQIENNDDDDIANMVLDDEMEAAALKIQAQFRGFQAKKKDTGDEISVDNEEATLDDDGEIKIVEPCACEIINEDDSASPATIEQDNEQQEDEEVEEDEQKEIKNVEVHEEEVLDEQQQQNEDEEIESVVENKEEEVENPDEIVQQPEATSEEEIEVKSSVDQEVSEQIDNEIAVDADLVNEIENSDLSDTLAEVPEMDTVVGIDTIETSQNSPHTEDENDTLIMDEKQEIESINAESENIEAQIDENLPEDTVECEMIDEQPKASLEEIENESAIERDDEQLEFEKIEREIDEEVVNEPEIVNDENLKTQSVEGIEEDQSDEIANNEDEITTDEQQENDEKVMSTSLHEENEDLLVDVGNDEKLEEIPQIDEENLLNETTTNEENEDEKIPVEEEICEIKKIMPLEDDEQIPNDETENPQNEDEDDENVEDIEYTKLEESNTTPVESMDEVDNNENIIEMSAIETATKEEEIEMKNDESSITEIESILKVTEEISPIELIDEVVNANAELAARTLFESTQVEPTTEITQSINNDNEDEVIEPQLKQEPLPSLDNDEKIDLSKEVIDVSQEEIEPMSDEILKPDEDVSEIPDQTQAPLDENQPSVTVSIEMNNVEENPSIQSEEVVEEKKENQDNDDDEIANMVLDDEMEAAALKIQAQFRGHNIRKSKQSNTTNDEESSTIEQKSVIESVEIDQCTDETNTAGETQENEENILSVEEGQEVECDDNVEAEVEVEEEETQEEAQSEVQEEENEEETAETEETAEENGETQTAEEIEEVNNPENQQNNDDESSEQQEAANNDDDDVANMVLDDEMEAAALKIQAQFRGIQIRKKPKDTTESVGESSSTKTDDKAEEETTKPTEVDDEIANMVLDDEMASAALKIQSTFRGHKARKEIKKEDDDEKKDETEEDEKKDEDEKKEEEATASSSTSEKSAQQLKDEEDIAGIVMDEEMEQTALKIQSVFRRKAKKPAPKDNGDEDESSSQTNDDDESDEKFKESEEKLDIGGESVEDERNSDYTAERERSVEENRYSIDQFDSGSEIGFYERNLDFFGRRTIEDPSLMQGGGVFVEPSYESHSTDLLVSSSGEDRDPDPSRSFSSYDKVPSDKSFEIPRRDSLSSEKSKQSSFSGEEKVIENFDFEAKKDTAEAMYYSLKKTEIETKRLEKSMSVRENLCDLAEETKDAENDMNAINDANLQRQDGEDEEEEDDDDVVIGIRPPPTSANNRRIMPYGMSMDERLLGSILSADYARKHNVVAADHYPDESFDPLLEATLREHKFLINRESSVRDFPDGVGDEDTFDDFDTSTNIRRRIMASSVSIADSFDFDPSNNKSIIDNDKIRTALETIQSTDSESTIGSAATKIQNVQQRRTSTTTAQYSSIGNSAIDRSLDEFIHSQELKIDRFEEEVEGINSPPPRKQQESAEEWTDDTTTYTDSEQRRIVGGGVIGIKVEQKSFLTVDERRRTLHREDAIQRNSTREDEDSSKSSNSSDKNEKKSSTIETTVAAELVPQDSVIDTEIKVPVIDLKMKAKPTQVGSVYPQRLRRQQTMPVQIQTDVIRVIPKHLRKRIKSAEVDKKKRKFEK